MRKVLHVSHSLDTGGGPLYIKKIIQDIPMIDHYVAGNTGYYYFLFRELLGDHKVKLLHGKNLLRNILVLKRICKEKSISVIHCHGRGAALYSRLLKIINPKLKIVYTVHGFHPDTLNAVNKALYIFMERILYHLTDVVINVSLSERERFIEKIKPAEKQKIHYIPNYIASNDIQPQPLAFEVDSNAMNFLYVGRLSPEKGIDILLEAWAKIQDEKCKLYIIGYGPLETLIPNQIKNTNIVYLGKVENARSFLGHFHALIIPSRFEGMPYVGLEAMMSKTCVIVTPAVGITDLFTADTSYMASDFSAKSLFDAIKTFVDDFKRNPKKIEEKIERNYERAQNEFSLENASKIYDIYNSLSNQS